MHTYMHTSANLLGVRHCWSWWGSPVLVFQWEPQLNILLRYASSCSYRTVITTATTFRAETSGNAWDCKPSQWLSAWKIQAGIFWFLHLFPLYLSLNSSSCYETQVTNYYHRCAPRCPTQQYKTYRCIVHQSSAGSAVMAFHLQHNSILDFHAFIFCQLQLWALSEYNIFRYLIFWYNHDYLWLLCLSTVTGKVLILPAAKNISCCSLA